MFIYRVQQPAGRLSLRVPITPTFSENCAPKETELTFVFITVLHTTQMNTAITSSQSMDSSFQQRGNRLLRHICYCVTLLNPELAINPTPMQAQMHTHSLDTSWLTDLSLNQEVAI